MTGFVMTLKCDEPDCDVEIECPDYGPNKVGTPCPKCGSSLLTQKDFEDAEPFRLLMVELHKAGIAKHPGTGGEGVLLGFNQHKGKTTITVQQSDGDGSDEVAG